MLILEEIVRSKGCVGCGACSAVCHENAIKIEQDEKTGLFFPFFDRNSCTQCGSCLKVCPAANWSNGNPSHQDGFFFGDNAQAYSAFAADKVHRISAASGGFVTAFLVALLKNRQIDGAVVSRRVNGDPLCSEVILAKNADEIMSCKGSIYSPVSFNQAFEQLKKVPIEERWAVVGLPCHIQAFALMKKQFLSFRKRVYLSISLVCGHFPTHRAYDYSFGRMRIKREEVQNIYNRGEGWPGYFRIQLKDGTIRSVPYGNSLSWGMVFASPLFTPKACHICPDPGGYAADIMVCDAWLPEFKENKEGVNLILAQTDIGRKLVKKVAESGEILLESRSVDDFVLANKRVFVTKIRNHDIALKSLFGKKAKFLHKNITGDFHASGPLLRIRLWCYYLHVKMALFFKLDRIVGMLPKAFLIYWKAITLLKR